jgi:hypothetical protein
VRGTAAGSWLAAFYRSTLGRKVVMAVTGGVLVLLSWRT